MNSRKQRLNPSKLLVLLLYGSYPYMDVDSKGGPKRVTLKIGPFARLLRVRNAHIIEYLEWLEQMGFITVTSRTKKTATIIVEPPRLFND